ncbi:synaptobrevin-domain-containing protein [Chytriomyces sp. MP71]|nr:synaptobrevin-domain-containing protein [Chytriomyces sp. MP71]
MSKPNAFSTSSLTPFSKSQTTRLARTSEPIQWTELSAGDLPRSLPTSNISIWIRTHRPHSQTTQNQQQVNEVIGMMHNNIEKVMARGEKLETLQNKTDDLQQGALQFKKGANKVRGQMWWKDLKMKLIIAAIIIIIIIVIAVPIATQVKAVTPSSAS